jgi:hypothetical protein
MINQLEYFRGNQDAITAAHIENAATSVAQASPHFVMGSPSLSWVIAKGAYLYQGNRMHGDSAPSWYSSTFSQPGDIFTRYWDALAPWGVMWTDATNTTTNAAACMYDVQIYTLSKDTGGWSRVPAGNGIPVYPFSFYPLDRLTYPPDATGTFIVADGVATRLGCSNVLTPADRATASADTAKYRILHNALHPMVEVDGSDVGGVFATMQAKLFTVDGAALNGVTKIYAQIGVDYKPDLASAINTAEFLGVYYYVGAGAGNLIELPADGSPVRVSFCTVGGTGYSTNIAGADDSVYGALNPVYLSHGDISANLPVLKFNPTA